MEEQKTKTVNMTVEKKEEENQQRYSYDELNKICGELYQQNQNLTRQMAQMHQAIMTKRLDYLFKVLEIDSKEKNYFSSDFIVATASEIEESLTVKEEDNKE